MTLEPGPSTCCPSRLLPEEKPARSLKHLIEAAPLDGVDLRRSRDTGRAVDLLWLEPPHPLV